MKQQSKEEREFISGACEGEKCSVCGKEAYAKAGEEILFDDPQPMRHNLTAYLCKEHFNMIFRPYLSESPTPSQEREKDLLKHLEWEDKILSTEQKYLTCEMCGINDESVKDKGFKVCPKCDEELSASIDAVEKYRDRNEEFDGGGGA